MNLVASAVTVVSGASRQQGWRGSLRDGNTTVWRCECRLPHARPDLASACVVEALSKRSSGFCPGGYDMNDWMAVPTTDADRQMLVEQLQSLPTTSDAALATLVVHRAAIMEADSYEDIRLHQGGAESIKLMWRANRDVRNEYDHTFLVGEWRIGQALLQEEQDGLEAVAGRPPIGNREGPIPNRPATIAEKLGNKMYGWRLKMVGALPPEALNSTIREIHQRDKEATLSGVVKLLRAEESAMRRLDSMTAPAIQNGMDLRIGDCRAVLSDIEDDSIPLILTDPPYENDAEPLWQWLAEFADRVLIPGGSLICYFGGANVNKLYRIFDDAGLIHWWPCVMLHAQAQRLAGKFVIPSHKPILWYVKSFRRGRALVPDVVHSRHRNKTDHAWGQGEGGISQWLHQLTEPGETIVDPFCGTADWGLAACEAGRYWIGSDIVSGGTTTVSADDIPVEEDSQ